MDPEGVAMSLSARIKELSQPVKRKCNTCRWIELLPAKERSALDEWVQLNRHGTRQQRLAYSIRALHRECEDMGLEASRSRFLDCIREHHADK